MGIAGLVAAIYPVESPGGYQLFGRTLPAWSPCGKGENFSSDKPWLLEPFDQVCICINRGFLYWSNLKVVFKPVTEEEYMKVGRVNTKILNHSLICFLWRRWRKNLTTVAINLKFVMLLHNLHTYYSDRHYLDWICNFLGETILGVYIVSRDRNSNV